MTAPTRRANPRIRVVSECQPTLANSGGCYPADDGFDDWESLDPEPSTFPIWEPFELDDDDEDPLPADSDFWIDPDELES